MKTDKFLLLTFDYELFLGANSGLAMDCAVLPTERILNVLNEYSLKGIFFIDTAYLLRLKNESSVYPELIEDTVKINNQLIELLKRGHYIFPHLHPHWTNAKYDPSEKIWILSDYKYYRFHNTSVEQRTSLFDASMNYIESLYNSVGRKIEVLGYRAGGWAIQPFSDFEPLFRKFGIQHDFSIIPGYYNMDELQYFDFRNVNDKVRYTFNSDDITSESLNGAYTEWPISIIHHNTCTKLFTRILNKYLWKTGVRSMGKGIGAKLKPSDKIHHGEMASVELLTKANKHLYLNYLKNHSGIHLITHPKMISEHNLKVFREFLKEVCSKYTIYSDFRDIQNLTN